MKYRRLKTITGDGTIMRYYELKDTVAYYCILKSTTIYPKMCLNIY